jgi:O-antigen/teichoic acid export membrane protein
MSDLISRGAILTASRMSNFAIQLLSPVLLVRILDVMSYGQYQEFMIYAVLLTGLCAFAVDSSLTYFLARFPERERSFVLQTSIITLGISSFSIGALMVAKPLLLQLTTFDFILPLSAYVFFFVNLSWLEYYWIAKREARKVLYYSAVRLILRVIVLLLVAYITRDVLMIVWSLAAIEALRVIWAFVYCARRGMFLGDLQWAGVAEQLRFAAPIGTAAAALMQNAGRNIGKIFISSTLGPIALAYYAIGSYLIPIIRLMRSGITDAIYPELVAAHDQRGAAVRLWQRVNVLNCVMFFPAFVLLVFYAEELITLLFTSAYLPAVPIFWVFACFLLRRCFNTDVLLRTTGRTGFMLWGTIGSLVVNMFLIVLLSQWLGMIGPAVAFLVAEIALELFYANRMSRTLGLSFANLADWRGISRIAASCVIAMPILLGFELLPGSDIIRAGIAAVLYFAIVLLIAYRLGVADIGRVVGFVLSRFHNPSID